MDHRDLSRAVACFLQVGQRDQNKPSIDDRRVIGDADDPKRFADQL